MSIFALQADFSPAPGQAAVSAVKTQKEQRFFPRARAGEDRGGEIQLIPNNNVPRPGRRGPGNRSLVHFLTGIL